MDRVLAGLVLTVVIVACASPPAADASEEVAGPVVPAVAAAIPFPVVVAPGDPALDADLARWLDTGRTTVETFFGRPFPESVRVHVHADRAAFTASFPPEWGLADTQCWMVAYGVADRLSLLSPRAWKAEACEHDAADDEHVQQIVTHELVHAFHGQHNPTRDFTGIEADVGWFAEGLGVLVSGQLDEERRAGAREAVAAGGAPERLATAWSGSARYGICGTLVEHLERTAGRDGLLEMLSQTDLQALLTVAGTDEETLLAEWRAALLGA